jgi:hypothetical protein
MPFRDGLPIAAFLLLAGCASSPTAPPPRDPAATVTPIEATGPVRITFVTASTPPGGAISGCGRFVEGCAGRLRIVLDLAPPADGPVLYVRVYLHSMRNGIACLSGTTGSMVLNAGQHTTVEVPLDSADVCATPETMATMDAIVEGPVQVASRQAWSIRYVFTP